MHHESTDLPKVDVRIYCFTQEGVKVYLPYWCGPPIMHVEEGVDGYVLGISVGNEYHIISHVHL